MNRIARTIAVVSFTLATIQLWSLAVHAAPKAPTAAEQCAARGGVKVYTGKATVGPNGEIRRAWICSK